MSFDDEEQLLSAVGQRIRAIRGAQGLNLNELARLTGISAPALSLIETGKRDPRLKTLAKIAAALRVSVAHLLEEGSNGGPGEGETSAQGYDLGDYL